MRFATRIAAILCLVLAGCVHPTARVAPGTDAMRVMSYNIRLDIASDGPNAWPNRRDLVVALVKREAPDIIGMQEVLLGQKSDLQAAMADYQFSGVGRDDGAEKGEFSPVAWKRDRFAVVEAGTFWLSPTPDIPGKGWDAAYPRIASWVLLRERRTGRTVHVLNTHFDHVGIEARARSGAMLADWSARQVSSGDSVIVLGDFNSTPDMPAIMTLADPAQSGLRDTRTISRSPPYGPAGTFNAFQIDRNDAAPIDHVFVSSAFDVTRHAVVTQHWGGRLPSDHYPVIVDVLIKR